MSTLAYLFFGLLIGRQPNSLGATPSKWGGGEGEGPRDGVLLLACTRALIVM